MRLKSKFKTTRRQKCNFACNKTSLILFGQNLSFKSYVLLQQFESKKCKITLINKYTILYIKKICKKHSNKIEKHKKKILQQIKNKKFDVFAPLELNKIKGIKSINN